MTLHFILHFTGLHIGSSVRYKNTLVGNYFLKCNKIDIILIPFSCFSEYTSNVTSILSLENTPGKFCKQPSVSLKLLLCVLCMAGVEYQADYLIDWFHTSGRGCSK